MYLHNFYLRRKHSSIIDFLRIPSNVTDTVSSVFRCVIVPRTLPGTCNCSCKQLARRLAAFSGDYPRIETGKSKRFPNYARFGWESRGFSPRDLRLTPRTGVDEKCTLSRWLFGEAKGKSDRAGVVLVEESGAAQVHITHRTWCSSPVASVVNTNSPSWKCLFFLANIFTATTKTS